MLSIFKDFFFIGFICLEKKKEKRTFFLFWYDTLLISNSKDIVQNETLSEKMDLVRGSNLGFKKQNSLFIASVFSY